MRYEVDKKSKADEGKVVISVYHDNGCVEIKERMHIRNNVGVYEALTNGEEVNLKNHYFEDFSIDEWTDYMKLGNKKYKVLQSLVEFEESYFEGTTDFYKTTFLKTASFENVTFLGSVNFQGVTFTETAYFKGATFLGRTYFGADIFGECAATFLRRANFVGTKFFEVADFNEVFFSDVVSFGGEPFDNVCFDDHNIYLERTTFFGEAIFKGAKFKNTFLLEGVTCYGLDVTVESCDYIDLSYSKVMEYINFPLKVNSIKELNILFIDIQGKVNLDWNSVKAWKMIYSDKYSKYKFKADQFLIFKENYNKQGKYNEEDNAYFHFKRCMRISRLHGEKIDNKYLKIGNCIWQSIWYLPKLLLFELIGGYGTKPFNVFVSILVVWIGFAFFYSILPDGSIIIDSGQELNEYVKYLYYSGITFLTIGYGDIKPASDTASMLCVIEGFMGIFLMSYFTVSFARKLLR